jgi:alpha-L-arabinofuranosidase
MTLIPILLLLATGHGQVEIDATKLGARVPKGLYGVFLEEINNAGEGGLYAEMIQNRGFEDANLPPACTLEGDRLATPKAPSFWEGYSKDWKMAWPYYGLGPTPFWKIKGASMRVVTDRPLSVPSPHAIQIEASPGAALINEGFWGMNVVKGEKYDLSLFAQTPEYVGQLEARLVGQNGSVLATARLESRKVCGWQKLETKLAASGTDSKAHFELVMAGKGRLLVDFVSLMPQKTWRGMHLRPDLAQMIADLKPGFVRWPGGCVTEGITIETRPQWQQTLGPLERRVPTFVPWGYWVSNGFGYHEWLEFCEKLGAEPLYVFNAGISCAFRSGTYMTDEELEPQIQSILDAIEYAIGPATSKYGAIRAKAGHPKPFAMHMIEIGNEDQGPKYGARFKRIAAAVKAKYPRMKTILSSWISGIDHSAINAAGPQMDVVDEHAYTPVNWAVQNFDSFAKYSRDVPWELYIGEFATNAGVGRGNMRATLGDAAYMMSMEKNADLVKMGSYAPLLENVNRREWEVNLIHFDSARAFGRASYYACKLFAENLPDVNLSTNVNFTPPPGKPISGPIGLATWLTSADFKEIEVDGKPIDVSTWKPQRGSWTRTAGTYSQRTRTDGDLWSYFGGDYHDMTLTLKARKVEGREGFVVSVGNAEGRRVQVNFGGWGNEYHAIEAQGVVRQVPGKIETGRWYDVRVVTRGRNVKAYLDNTLVLDETLPQPERVLGISGRDDKTGEIILKLLNTGDAPVEIGVVLRGATLSGRGTLAELASDDASAENSFASPSRIAPKVSRITTRRNGLTPVLPAHSLSIFRLGTK